jgi:hypothetical protein
VSVGGKSELKLENLDVKAAVLLAFLCSLVFLGFAVAVVVKLQLASVETFISRVVGFFFS